MINYVGFKCCKSLATFIRQDYKHNGLCLLPETSRFVTRAIWMHGSLSKLQLFGGVGYVFRDSCQLQ